MRTNKLIGMSMIFLLLLSMNVLGLGVSPAKKIVEFQPQGHASGTITVHNNDRADFRVVIFTRGEMANFIQLGENTLEFTQNTDKKSFKYDIILPTKIEKPGTHVGEIVVRELPSGDKDQEIVVDALVAVVSEVQVRVPYPGRYVEGNLEVTGANEGGQVNFFLLLTNLGSLDVEKAEAFINIYDQDNNLLDVVRTETKPIKKGERVELLSTWTANVKKGTYTAQAFIDYDKAILNLQQEFTVGDFFIDLLDISVKNFQLGGIAKFSTLVENQAAEEVEEFTTEMELLDKDGNVLTSLQSLPINVPASTKREAELFWDTDGVEEGVYDGTFTLQYGGKESEKKIRVHVKEDEIITEIVGITGFVTASVEEPGEVSTMWMIVLGVVALLATNLAWLLYTRKKK